ncbi:MAG: efflux RND transporter periplasmic adaptor subunit [Pseudomonadota bacterium]
MSSHRLSRFLLILTFGILAACGGGGGDTAAEDDTDVAEANADADNTSENQEDEVIIPVEVVNVTRGDVYAAYTGTASLQAFDEAQVVAKVGGEVREILVEEGQYVKRNAVLARLDGDRLRLQLEQSRANLAKLQQEYQRNVELHERGLVAASAFETTKYELDALKAAYNLAKLEYEYTTIRAPITGVVSRRDIKVGNTIDINAPTFTITALDPLIADLFIPEREFGRIAADQSVRMTIDALPDQAFGGTIARISPTVDAESGTFKATVEIKDDGTRLKPGMFGRFAIIYDQQSDKLLLPRDALMESDRQNSVYVVTDGVANRIDVETGYIWDNQVAILEGIDDTARVVTVGQAALKDGSKVRVVGDPVADEEPEDEESEDNVRIATSEG